MRHIKLVLDDKQFMHLEKLKKLAERERGGRLSWEQFMINAVNSI